MNWIFVCDLMAVLCLTLVRPSWLTGHSVLRPTQSTAHAVCAEEKGEQEEKAEEPSPASHVPKGLPRMGFGANVIADLKAQKRFSTRLPSPVSLIDLLAYIQRWQG